MTRDAIVAEAMAYAATLFDAAIEKAVREHEAVIRRDLAASGPEDEDMLDRPPDPDSDWQLSTVEETMVAYADVLQLWRALELLKLHWKVERFVNDRLHP